MVDHLPLGGIAFQCKGLASSRNKTLRDWTMKMCRSAGTLNSFGEELLEVSKKRNIAAHGSGALPAQALVDSKNYVYNKTYTRELKNLLIRFLQLIK